MCGSLIVKLNQIINVRNTARNIQSVIEYMVPVKSLDTPHIIYSFVFISTIFFIVEQNWWHLLWTSVTLLSICTSFPPSEAPFTPLGFGHVVCLVCLYCVNKSHGFGCLKGTSMVVVGLGGVVSPTGPPTVWVECNNIKTRNHIWME